MKITIFDLCDLDTYSGVPIKCVDALDFFNFSRTDAIVGAGFDTYWSRFDVDIDVKTALVGVGTGPNRRICLGRVERVRRVDAFIRNIRVFGLNLITRSCDITF